MWLSSAASGERDGLNAIIKEVDATGFPEDADNLRYIIEGGSAALSKHNFASMIGSQSRNLVVFSQIGNILLLAPPGSLCTLMAFWFG
jgi:hypothetical protein